MIVCNTVLERNIYPITLFSLFLSVFIGIDEGSIFYFYRGDPYTFQVGAPTTMRAFNYGVGGMCIGERRRFLMPPEFVTDNFHTGTVTSY